MPPAPECSPSADRDPFEHTVEILAIQMLHQLVEKHLTPAARAQLDRDIEQQLLAPITSLFDEGREPVELDRAVGR